MMQVLQLLTVVGVGIALAWYGLLQDRREHTPVDPRQPSIPFPPGQNSQDRELVTR
jgi:hypothetical protein